MPKLSKLTMNLSKKLLFCDIFSEILKHKIVPYSLGFSSKLDLLSSVAMLLPPLPPSSSTGPSWPWKPFPLFCDPDVTLPTNRWPFQTPQNLAPRPQPNKPLGPVTLAANLLLGGCPAATGQPVTAAHGLSAAPTHSLSRALCTQ